MPTHKCKQKNASKLGYACSKRNANKLYCKCARKNVSEHDCKCASKRAEIVIIDEIDEASQASKQLLARTLAHSKRVEKFAKKLFKDLKPLHNLPSSYCKLLSIAALLHDIGWIYGQYDHHKNSAKMIYNFAKHKKFIPIQNISAPINLYLQNEMQALLAKHLSKIDKNNARIIALVARYHRKGPVLNSHSIYKKLNEENKLIVRKLASIIRIADALDFTHLAQVKDIKTVIENNAVIIKLSCNDSCQAEQERVNIKKQLFLDTYTINLECERLSKIKEK